jgi:hypothetical protein
VALLATVSGGALLAAAGVRRLKALRVGAKEGLTVTGWAVGVVATSQVAVKWPFGPLLKTFLVTWSWLLVVGAGWAWAWRRAQAGGGDVWRVVGACGVGVAGWWGVLRAFDGEHLQTKPEVWGVGVGVWALLCVALGWLWWTGGRGKALGATLGAALGAAALYRWVALPWAAWVALGVLAGVAVWVWTQARGWEAETKRAAVWGWSLALGHVMASDWVALVWLLTLPLWWGLSRVALPPTLAGRLGLAWLIALTDITLFYLVGYRFSLSAMDVQVAFMLDRAGIHIGVGLALLLLQHATPWLMAWGVVWMNRARAGDTEQGPQALLWALVMVIALRCWGPFWGLAWKSKSFWYTSHAVPMFLISVLIGAVVIGAGSLVSTLWQGRVMKGR